MTKKTWHVAVLIPAHNEEKLLPRCLQSVLIAASFLPSPVTSDIVVAADSSTDHTVQIARDLLGSRGCVVGVQANSAGMARAVAAKYALIRHEGPTDRFWLANTDADCIIPPTWLSDQITFAEQGIEAIAGTVSVDSFEEHEPHVAARFAETYQIYADGSHPHIHGANLGVRADIYLKVGGWADLSTAEDHDLWNRLKQNRSATLSSALIELRTSGRRVGRAPHGFAEALAAHNHI
jgi:glycosyltransferase involved in cell wall biosynthesis